MKRATSGFLAVVGLLLLLALPSPADKGYADFSIWNRSLLYRDPLSGRPSSAETVLHLEAVQDITNYGSVSLWTDALYASNGDVRLSRISAGWAGFRYKGMRLSATLGDGNIVNTNLESRFVNQYHPYIYFRGFSAEVAAEKFDLSAFGGKAARLSGLLGSSYEIKDQPLFGIKGRWKLGRGGIVGAAIIHTRPDPADITIEGIPVPEKNTVVCLDAEARVSEGAKILGEFRTSLTPEASPAPGASNSLRFGPLFRAGKWDVEANYRYTGSRFQEINRQSQIVRDERGLFSSVRYQVSRSLTVFGIADRYTNNTDRDPEANTTRAWSIISGFHLSTRSLVNLTAQWEFQDRLLERAQSGRVRYGAKGVFIQASKTMGSFFPYLRVRLLGVRDAITPEVKTFVPAIYAGFRKMLSSGSFIWVEGQFDERSMFEERRTEEESDEDRERIIADRTFILRTGWNQNLSPDLDVYAELFYERYGKVQPFSQIVGYVGVRIGLPKNLDLRIDLRATEPLGQRSDRTSNYQLNLRIDKRFSWGLEPKILGRQGTGGETIGLGTVDGFVFEDRDRDGIMGPGEKGVSGISLRLEDGSKTVTGSDGRYRFEHVAEGPHQVRIEENRIPALYYLLSPVRVNVLVEPRQIQQVSFLLISGANLSGRFLDDTNRNGKADPEDKGLADILVILTPVAKTGPEAKPAPAEAGLILNTYSDADGGFRFINILPGEYELSVDSETLPQGAALTVPLPLKIVLEPGQSSAVQTFLIAPRPVIRKK